MKKRTALLVTIILAMTAAACGSDEKTESTAAVAEESSYIADETQTEGIADDADTAEADDVTEDDDTAPTADTDEIWHSGDLVFETTDISGDAVTDEIIKGSELVMLNLWEPWCGPCVNEMPDLELLYENYKGSGLLILGAYTTFEMDAEAKEIVDSSGITYPILKADSNLLSYEQNYVPATFLFDGNGNLLSDEPVAGSQSYDEWERIVRKYLPR